MSNCDGDAGDGVCDDSIEHGDNEKDAKERIRKGRDEVAVDEEKEEEEIEKNKRLERQGELKEETTETKVEKEENKEEKEE